MKAAKLGLIPKVIEVKSDLLKRKDLQVPCYIEI